MADVRAGVESGLDVGAVVGIDVHGVVRALALCRVDELTDDLIAVGAAGVLGADGDLTLGAAKSVADAAHVHAYRLRDARRDGRGAAVADLLIHGDVYIYAARRGVSAVPDVLRKTQKYPDGELVVKETALYVAGGSDSRPRVEADDIPHLDAQRPHVLLGFHVLVQQDLGRVKAALRVGKVPVHMDGGVAELERAFVYPAVSCVNTDIFGLAVFGPHPAQRGETEPSGGFYLRHHAAEGVGMRLQKESVAGVLPAEIDYDAALNGEPCVKAQLAEGVPDPFRRLGGIAAGAVDGKKLACFFYGKIGISLYHVFFLFHRMSPDYNPDGVYFQHKT